MDLALAIYQLTKGFPKHKHYGLANQMQGAAVSIPSKGLETSVLPNWRAKSAVYSLGGVAASTVALHSLSLKSWLPVPKSLFPH